LSIGTFHAIWAVIRRRYLEAKAKGVDVYFYAQRNQLGVVVVELQLNRGDFPAFDQVASRRVGVSANPDPSPSPMAMDGGFKPNPIPTRCTEVYRPSLSKRR
jgi:hypothetical protein